MRRSMLFLPGNTPNMIINGDALGADSIILDLEDAVSPDEKDSARLLVRSAMKNMGFAGCEITVRINSIDTDYWKDDLEAVIPLKPDLIMPPKASCAEDMRCKRTKQGNEINYARTRLVCAARAAGVDVYDTPFTDVNDDEGIVRDAEYAKSLGFSGKSAIAPRHVRVINEVFSPSAKDIEYARLVFEAIRIGKEQGKGAVSLRGKMIDKPIVERARQTLEIAKQLGLDGGAE